MFSFFVTDKEKRDSIINYFKEKNVSFFLCEQYTLTKECQSHYNIIEELYVERNFVYLFQWKNKKVKKEHLMKL